jgi:hypothetical protein
MFISDRAALRGSGQRRQRHGRNTVVAPLELVRARQPEPSVEWNSVSFCPMWPEWCRELTLVILERQRYRNTALDDTASASGDGGGRLQGPDIVGDRSSGGGGGRRWLAGH